MNDDSDFASEMDDAADTDEAFSDGVDDDPSFSDDDGSSEDGDPGDDDRVPAFSMHGSVQIRRAHGTLGCPAFDADSIQLLDHVSSTIDEIIADQITRSNRRLFAAVLDFLQSPAASLRMAVVATGADRSDNALRFERLRDGLIRSRYQVGLLQNGSSVAECLSAVVISKRAGRSPLVVLIDSIERFDQALINGVLQRLSSVDGLSVVVGVSFHSAVLSEILLARTMKFLTIREFSVQFQPSDKAVSALLLNSRLPVQFGPESIRYLRRKYDDAHRSLRVLAHHIRSGVMLFVGDRAARKRPAHGDAFRAQYWQAFALFCKLVDGFWAIHGDQVSIATFASPVDTFLALQCFDPGHCRDPIARLCQLIETSRNRIKLEAMLGSWLTRVRKAQLVAETQALERILDALAHPEAPPSSRAPSVQKGGRVSRRLMEAVSQHAQIPAVNAASARIAQFLREFIRTNLPPFARVTGSDHFVFDDVRSLEQLNVDDIESFALSSLRARPDLDASKLYGYICEAPSISVDYGSIFSKFKCMDQQRGDNNELETRFLQAIDDLCVLGVVAPASRPGCIDRIVSTKFAGKC